MSTDIWELIATERNRLADELEELTPQQWATQSQCEAWTVKQLAAHLVVPFEVSTPKFILAMARNRFNFDKTMIDLAAVVDSQNSTEQIIAKLRANSDNRWTPPKAGPEAPMSEIVVHGQDIRRALGLKNTVPSDTVDRALEGITDADVLANYTTRIG